MNLLYIDANIFLRFYDSKDSNFKKLLKAITELTDNIFFTSQFAFEIDRNKLSIFADSVTSYTKQSELSKTSLPDHLDNSISPKLVAWNKKREEIYKEISTSNTELAVILNEIMKNISSSKDSVSLALSGLYKNSYIYSEYDLAKARLRKEIGNPPGKQTDPLGDQFSWELLLNLVPHVKKLWIVSNDMDYFSKNNKTLYLNPVLYKDLMTKNDQLDVRTFTTLADAMKDFNTVKKIESIPSEEELVQISQDEKDVSIIGNSRVFVSHHGGYDTFPDKPLLCPSCNAKNSFLNGAFLRSQYGGLTLQYICSKCGFHYDTGDFFD